jgi:hypothetical protein
MIGIPRMNDRERAKFTINARLNRLEEQVTIVNTKLDDCLNLLRMLPFIKNEENKQIVFNLEENI